MWEFVKERVTERERDRERERERERVREGEEGDMENMPHKAF